MMILLKPARMTHKSPPKIAMVLRRIEGLRDPSIMNRAGYRFVLYWHGKGAGESSYAWSSGPSARRRLHSDRRRN